MWIAKPFTPSSLSLRRSQGRKALLYIPFMACLPPVSCFPIPVPRITSWMCFLGCCLTQIMTNLVAEKDRNLFLPVLETRSPQSRWWQGCPDSERGCWRRIPPCLFWLLGLPVCLACGCLTLLSVLISTRPSPPLHPRLPSVSLRAFVFGFRTYKGNPE